MSGGPVGPIEGDYVNGTSTSGTDSHESSPRLRFKDFDDDDDNNNTPQPHASPRAGTWPLSPSLPVDPAQQAQGFDGGLPHTSHPITPPGIHECEPNRTRSRPYSRGHEYAEDTNTPGAAFPRISRPVELLRRSYDCVVIGSGYGGAVAASRMARAGESVCVLERGKEKWPGEYPSGSADAVEELHWSGNLQPSRYLDDLPVGGGDPTGMYHLIFGKGQNAVVCNGEHCRRGTRSSNLFGTNCMLTLFCTQVSAERA